MIFRVSFEKGVVEYFDHQTFEKSSKVMTAKVRELTIFFSLKCGQAAHPVELKLRSGGRNLLFFNDETKNFLPFFNAQL